MAIDDRARALDYCSYCPKLCRHACPVSNATGKETLIPQAKMHLTNMMRTKAIGWQGDYVEALYGCTGCKLCQQYCLHGNDVAGALWEARAAGRSHGLAHPAVQDLPQRFRQRNEELSQVLRDRVPAARRATEARVGWLPGCDALARSPEDLDEAFRIFDHLRLDFIRVVDAPLVCAGYPLWAAGCLDAARFVAEEVVRALRRYTTVVVSCAACTHLLREQLPAEGFRHNIEILHLTEYLAQHAERIQPQRLRPAAFYHDPCYLGRRLGVYDPPRRLVGRCVESLREFFHSRELGECCGGGGGIPATYPEAARGQASRRLAEPPLFGVDLVVTACPTCKRTLRAAQQPLEVLDVVNLVSWAIEAP